MENIPKIHENVWKIIVRLCKSISVEPVMCLTSFGLSLYYICEQTALYNAVCAQNFDFERCEDLHVNSTDESHVRNFVQHHTNLWSMYKMITYFFPAIFVDTILGNYC